MITERDVDQAIAECLAERDPNAWTAMRLASFLTIRTALFSRPAEPEAPRPAPQAVSLASGSPHDPPGEIIRYTSGTEFACTIDGKPAASVWPIIDELMSVTRELHPRIYKAVLDKIK